MTDVKTMRVPGRTGMIGSAVGLATIALVVLLAIGAWGRSAGAQDATPDASPAATDCATAIGVGAAGDACVNVVHASPDAPAVDVYVDGALAIPALAFPGSSGWVALPAGEHQVDVVATGTDISTAVISAPVDLAAGTAYEIAAVGLLAEIAPAVTVVDVSDLDAGTARIQVVHASPDAGPVDVAVTGGDVLVPNLMFPMASGFLEVPAGSYDLEVRAAGTTTVALPLPGVALEGGTVYSVYAVGTAADGTLNVLVISTPLGGGSATPEASPAA